MEGRECWAEVRQGRRDYTRSPNFWGDPGIALCPAPQQALRWQPARSLACSLSPSPRFRREPGGRGGGRPAGALCKSWCVLGGWGGGREEGEINLFGWSRVWVSRFPYPGIAGGAAIGSEDHVGP